MNQWLLKKGWRLIGSKRTRYGLIYCWDHPDHQPDERGYFTTTDARIHQKMLDKGWPCDCIKRTT